jgi:cell division topological specificity factor
MMSWLSLLLRPRRKSAKVAKQRLQVVLAQERQARAPRRPDYLPALQRELQMVVAKYVKVAPRDVEVRFAYPRHSPDGLEVRIELPQAAHA